MSPYPESWSDMSDYVVHFTTAKFEDDDYDNMMSIYSTGTLIPAREFGIGRQRAPAKSNQKAVCFSEIPPGQWHRLIERRNTKYGLGFSKSYVRKKGGGPIWYVYKDSPHWFSLNSMMIAGKDNVDAEIWNLTPLIDAPGTYQSDYYFEWEREWRHIGALNFSPKNVAFLLLPESFHDFARDFFQDAYDNNLGPAYFCPYVDPSWEHKRILDTIKRGQDSGN